jgi:hypothetical protein
MPKQRSTRFFGQMNGNLVTILCTLGGVLVGFFSSLWLAHSGKRSAKEDADRLREKLAGLQELFAGVKKDLETQFKNRPLPNTVAEPGMEAKASITAPKTGASSSTIDNLVRVSLASLLDAKGDVELSRLVAEVTRTVGAQNYPAVLDSIKRLKAEGAVDWEGDDLASGALIHVLPHR